MIICGKRNLGKIAAVRQDSAYLPCHIRRTLYLSIVLPHLDYCSVVWGNCRVTSSLECVQNYTLRVSLNKPPCSNTEVMQSQLSLPLSQAEGKPLRYCKSAGVLADVPLHTHIPNSQQETPFSPTILPLVGPKISI